jgi:hypothetical protein
VKSAAHATRRVDPLSWRLLVSAASASLFPSFPKRYQVHRLQDWMLRNKQFVLFQTPASLPTAGMQ